MLFHAISEMLHFRFRSNIGTNVTIVTRNFRLTSNESKLERGLNRRKILPFVITISVAFRI